MWDSEAFAARNGANSNANGGYYVRGATYGLAKKLQVAAAYEAARARSVSPSLNGIAKQCSVSWHFVEKIRDELLEHGRVRRPSEIQAAKDIPRGAGSKTLDEFDRFILLQLMMEEPSRSRQDYADWLYEYTGTVVSLSTISRFFLEAFPIKGGFVKPNLTPYDKFKPENETRAYQYLYMLSWHSPERVKFGDEKCLKGQELFNRRVRRNPITGEVCSFPTPSDFRNTHSITGFCGIDRGTKPVWYRIHKETNDSEEFMSDIEAAVATEFLVPGDVLVLDNVAYHTGKKNHILEQWLWSRFSIFVLFLPPRCPEWNPIELVWNTLVQRLRTEKIAVLRERYGTKDMCARAAKDILDGMTHDLVKKFYDSCYKGVL